MSEQPNPEISRILTAGWLKYQLTRCLNIHREEAQVLMGLGQVVGHLLEGLLLQVPSDQPRHLVHQHLNLEVLWGFIINIIIIIICIIQWVRYLLQYLCHLVCHLVCHLYLEDHRHHRRDSFNVQGHVGQYRFRLEIQLPGLLCLYHRR